MGDLSLQLMRSEFITALKANQAAFGVDLAVEKVEELADYFELVQQHNPILHLVAPTSPEEFAVRHVLESLILTANLPENGDFADVGAGAGLPSIPCLLAREDLNATLIESKIKKARFLVTVLAKLRLASRAAIVNRQFAETEPGACEFVTCRALDKFADQLPKLLKWADGRRLLLFGGPNLAASLEKANARFESQLLPLSDRRYLFTVQV